MNRSNHLRFHWSGSETPFLDTCAVTSCGPVVIGRYGGCTRIGACKNEDAALVWAAPDGAWTFAALLDAHGASESADLVLGRVAKLEETVVRLLDHPADSADTAHTPPLWELSARVVGHLGNAAFRRACAAVRGETALLLCAQWGAYLWWLSVGDIPVYVFHPEFARLGQFALNQRMFFEWVGQVNTFALPVPCYTTGVRQLRPGHSRLLLTTDGLLECGTPHPFADPKALYDLFTASDATGDALGRVHTEQGRDSATLIAWETKVPESGDTMQPSA